MQLKLHRTICVLFLLVCASCTVTETQVIPADELQPASYPNIKRVLLTDSNVISFNSQLGWYNLERQFIEGQSVTGSRDTIPISRIKTVLLSETRPSILTTVVALTGMTSMALLIGLFVYVILFGGRTATT